MADIVFLLLIFFLVTTTILAGKGIAGRLPAWTEEPPTTEIANRNILLVKLNARNELFVENSIPEVQALRQLTRDFIMNPTGLGKGLWAILLYGWRGNIVTITGTGVGYRAILLYGWLWGGVLFDNGGMSELGYIVLWLALGLAHKMPHPKASQPAFRPVGVLPKKSHCILSEQWLLAI